MSDILNKEEVKKVENFSTVQKLVPLVSIKPNPWNPNIETDDTFKKLKESITQNGFTCPILVRSLGNEEYQIIDGFHRYKACMELGYSGIRAEDMGIVDDNTAKSLTLLLNNLRGKDDIFKRVEILKVLSAKQKSLFPWSEQEMQNQIALTQFDWSRFDKEEVIEEKKDYTIYFALTESQYTLIKHCMELTGKKDVPALLALVKDYLELREDISKYQKVWESTLD